MSPPPPPCPPLCLCLPGDYRKRKVWAENLSDAAAAQWSSRTHSTSFRKFGDNCLETSQKLLGMILDTQTNIEKSLGVLLCTVKFSSVLYHIVIIQQHWGPNEVLLRIYCYQYSTIKYSEVHYSTLQYRSVQYRLVQYTSVQYITVPVLSTK